MPISLIATVSATEDVHFNENMELSSKDNFIKMKEKAYAEC